METRKIKVYSTKSPLQEINIPNKEISWGEMKAILDSHNILHTGMNAMENSNNSQLAKDFSKVPLNATMIVLTPIKTKSGLDVDALSYKELRSTIQQLIADEGEVAAEHFNKDKNYTNKSTAVMRELLKTWQNDAEKVSDSHFSKEDIIQAILNLPDYAENSSDYDKAIDCLNGECQEPKKVTLTDKEKDFLQMISSEMKTDEDFDDEEDEEYDDEVW